MPFVIIDILINQRERNSKRALEKRCEQRNKGTELVLACGVIDSDSTEEHAIIGTIVIKKETSQMWTHSLKMIKSRKQNIVFFLTICKMKRISYNRKIFLLV